MESSIGFLPNVIQLINRILLEKGFQFIPVDKTLEKLSFSLPKGLKSKDIGKEGKYPVISQSKDYIIGYCNNRDLLIEKDLPLIIFGDHSKTIKYVDHPFIIGADGVKLIKPKKDLFLEKFFYYFLFGVITDTKSYGRHYSLLRKGFLPKIETSLQGELINLIEDHQYQSENILINEISKEVNLLLKSASIKNEISYEITAQFANIRELRQAFLKEAMQGKLVSNETSDGKTGADLLAEIQTEKEKLIKEKKIKKQKPLPPISEEEIPFDIPGNWVWCRIQDISSKIGSGSTPKGSNYSQTGYPFFRSQNIYNENLIYNDIKFIDEETQQRMNGTVVLNNDLLLNITGGSLGRCALVPNDFKQGNVSQHVCIIRGMKIIPKFYHYLVLSPYFQKLVFQSTTGAGREGLPKYNLEQFVIGIPPLEIQNRIVSKLEELMTYCDALETSVKESQNYNDQLLQQVLREALEVKEVAGEVK